MLQFLSCGNEEWFCLLYVRDHLIWREPSASTSSETQGQSVAPGEKAGRKFSSTGGRALVYRLSPDHFQTVKRMLAPDWAQKMLCIIVPNRRTVSDEFLSWVRTRVRLVIYIFRHVKQRPWSSVWIVNETILVKILGAPYLMVSWCDFGDLGPRDLCTKHTG